MGNKQEKFQKLLSKIREIINTKNKKKHKLLSICNLLHDSVDYYDWVGFYLLSEDKKELNLELYAGEPTEHLNIPVGKGICGQVAESGKTLIIQDVTKEDNYLSCSINVKSEIVVPIFKNKEIIAELDIDSHAHSPFTKKDKIFLEKVCRIVARTF